MSSPGQDLGLTERATVSGGVQTVNGTQGILAGTVVGPLAWDEAYEVADQVTYATETYGVQGVLLLDSENGKPSTMKVEGRAVVRISGIVQIGDLLSLDPGTPGYLHRDTTGTATPIARALSDSGGGQVLARLFSMPIIQPDASGV